MVETTVRAPTSVFVILHKPCALDLCNMEIFLSVSQPLVQLGASQVCDILDALEEFGAALHRVSIDAPILDVVGNAVSVEYLNNCVKSHFSYPYFLVMWPAPLPQSGPRLIVYQILRTVFVINLSHWL